MEARTDRLLELPIASEQDIVTARQSARKIAEMAGFDHQAQIRVATALSEIARNAYQYARDGRIDFDIEQGSQCKLRITVSDRGEGIRAPDQILDGTYRSPSGMGLGIVGARRLSDEFELQSEPGRGTTVRMWKYLPLGSSLCSAEGVRKGRELLPRQPADPNDEFLRQSRELLDTLDRLRQREEDLRRQNQELEDTNRGVMALYAELDERAMSLRRADEIKSKFLSHVSHEFRTPLNSILALTGLLKGRCDGDLNPEQEKQIDFIRKAAEELRVMVDDLLDLAKVEAGKIAITEVEFTLESLFGALRGMMRPLRTSEAVDLIFEEPGSEYLLFTDEAKVAQILRNLVSNALKFTERGEVRVSLREEADWIVFSVSDTGIGIRLQDQQLIFQEFAQVEHSLQKNVKGTGLGLPLSRKLAELLGGKLLVESEEGRGSVFTFYLPSRVLVRRTAPQAKELGTLLVVDDDDVARYLVRQMLRKKDVEILEADGGSVGIDRARFERPDAILLDLSMPDMSGFEVLEVLRQVPETSETPIIIYTSRHLTPADREHLAKAHCAVLSKRQLDEASFLGALEEARRAVQSKMRTN